MLTSSSKTYGPSLLIRIFPALPSVLIILIVLGFVSARANASAPNRIPPSYTSIAAAPGGGFWIQVGNGTTGGETLAVGGAPQYASVHDIGSIASVPGQNAYWVVTVNGFIYARGGAPELCGGYLGNCSGFGGQDRITGAAASPNGDGFWAVDQNRHVWTAGNVISYGDVTNDDQTPSGIVATPSGRGYYVVMSDGGVFSFGDAVFYGSTGGHRPGGHDVTGLALSLDFHGKVNGYWMLADDGAIYTYGDAPFLGNAGVNSEFATSVVARPGGHSYAWVLANGQPGLSLTLPTVLIRSDKYNTVWGIPGGSEASTPLQLMVGNNSTSQEWLLWPTTTDGKTVQIVNVNSGLCADVTQRDQYPWGSYLIQYPCKGKTEGWNNQRFTIIAAEPGHVQFLPVSPTETVVFASGAGSELTLIQYLGGQPTSWTLNPVDSAVPSTATGGQTSTAAANLNGTSGN